MAKGGNNIDRRPIMQRAGFVPEPKDRRYNTRFTSRTMNDIERIAKLWRCPVNAAFERLVAEEIERQDAAKN
jgi:hypothetical protein